MAVFTAKTSFPAVSIRRPRVLAIRFGDGYEQRAGDGINTDLGTWDLTFTNLPTTEADDIETFLAPLAGVTKFQWTPPRSVTQGNYICREWTRTVASPGADNIRAKFEEVPEA